MLVDKFTYLSLKQSIESVWLYVYRVLIFLPLLIFIYLLYIITTNSSHGFDITDESFGLLGAIQPENVTASSSCFGYYTRLLYLLSGSNIAIFRIYGILALLAAAALFSYCLQRYWNATHVNHSKYPELIMIYSVILTGALACYRHWMFTPSYNWLALFSVLLTGSGFLAWASNKRVSDHSVNPILQGLLTGFGGGLAFMAKPSSAVMLAVTAVCWVAIHALRAHKCRLFMIASLISSVFFLSMHALVTKGSVVLYFNELRAAINLSLLFRNRGHIGNMFLKAIEDLIKIPKLIFHVAPAGFIMLPIILLVIWIIYEYGKESRVKKFHAIFLLIFNGYIWHQLRVSEYFSRRWLGLSGITILMALVVPSVLSFGLWNNSRARAKLRSFSNLILLLGLLFLLAVSYAFGTSDFLIRRLSQAYVFFAAGSIYAVFWIDRYAFRTFLSHIIPVLVSLAVLITLLNAYRNPYRLPTDVGKQVIGINFLGGGGTLHVDKLTADYINGLKDIAKSSGWIPGMPLIDLTGASPGASMILGARIMGRPWLVGGYEGSDLVAETALAMVPRQVLKSAWLLTAPEGKRSLSMEVLSNLGLKHPDDYKGVGEILTGFRRERQILWKPKVASSEFKPGY